MAPLGAGLEQHAVEEQRGARRGCPSVRRAAERRAGFAGAGSAAARAGVGGVAAAPPAGRPASSWWRGPWRRRRVLAAASGAQRRRRATRRPRCATLRVQSCVPVVIVFPAVAEGAGSRGSRRPRRTAGRGCSRSARSRRAAARRAGSRRSRTTARRRPRARTARRRGSSRAERPRDVLGRAGRVADVEQAAVALARGRVLRRARHRRVDPELRADALQEGEVHLAEQLGVEPS